MSHGGAFPVLTVDEAWVLAGRWSPRSFVWASPADAYGEFANSYPLRAATAGPVPVGPWALPLADEQGNYPRLGFDFDSKPFGAQVAQDDAAALSGLLHARGIAHVVCESSPSSRGRHVWVALVEPAPAVLVASLAAAAHRLFRSLDWGMLCNITTGCLRPPGAPHRDGGASVVLEGDLDALGAGSTTLQAVVGLVDVLDELAPPPPAEPGPTGPLPVDGDGRLYLPGGRRELPAYAATALEEDVTGKDASVEAWRVVLGAAAARWRHADLVALVGTSPGLEHLRTVPAARGARKPRPRVGSKSAPRVLQRMWDRAVVHVAARRGQGHDPSFPVREAGVTSLVAQLQQRADAAPGRWAHHGGPADRRVLDSLHQLALEAVSTVLEADIRRLGTQAGIGRETARVALLRLQEDGWVRRVQEAEGPRGARWTIDPQSVLHRGSEPGRSQEITPPQGLGTRGELLARLRKRTGLAAHDVFTTRGGLGLHAGNVYSRLPDVVPVGADVGLRRLQRVGLAVNARSGWQRGSPGVRDEVAVALGVDGRLADRRRQYALERELWAWWQAEREWMDTPGPQRPRRRPAPGQGMFGIVDDARRPAYPRGPDGRGDHRAARICLTGSSPVKRTLSILVRVSPAHQLVVDILGATFVGVETVNRSGAAAA